MAVRLTTDQALESLMAGNRRYIASQRTYPHQTPDRKAELTSGQRPFAAILGCSDSRVPPELIFDQGLGDLFVVRVAGNVTNDMVLASIEYAATHLHVPLIMVLGHSECGAVGAAIEGGDVEGHVSSLVAAIKPAIERSKGKMGSLTNNVAKVNAEMVSRQLEETSQLLSELVNKAVLKVVAAFYDLRTGAVEILL